jgi:hypothetical protein
MKNNSYLKEKFLFIAGLLFISSGIILNEWLLAAVFSSDGEIAASHRIVIWIVDIFLIILGMMTVKYRKSLTGEKVYILAGILLILTGFFVNERVLSVLMGMPMSSENKMFIRITELYIIITGIMAVLYRKRLRMSSIVLFCISSMFCFMIFLSYDFYRAYSILKDLPRVGLKHRISNIHIIDNHLGWKPKANSTGKHVSDNYDVTYEIDENGFKKINNIENPDFSIYFFGDSFTFGGGVTNRDTFPNIIKDRYLSKEVNIYNAAVMGYGIVQNFQRFLDLEEMIQPGDLVIVSPLSSNIQRNIKEFHFPYLVYFTNLAGFPVEKYPFFDGGIIKYHTFENDVYHTLKLLSFFAPYTKTFWRNINKKFIPDTTKEAIEMIQIIEGREIRYLLSANDLGVFTRPL